MLIVSKNTICFIYTLTKFKNTLSLTCIEKFKLCVPFDGSLPEDTAQFMSSIVGMFELAVQYDFNGRDIIDIKTFCEIMQNEEFGTPLDRLSELNR